MRKALVGAIVVGVLAFPAPAAAKELAFQGGEPFGAPPVGMTMTGKSFKKPKRVTGFSISGEFECGIPGDPLTLPIPQGTNGKGIEIKKNKKYGTHFRWDYTEGNFDAAYTYYELQGVQNSEHPREWIGVVVVFRRTGPADAPNICFTAHELTWEAEFTGLI
jgi:hypothetical protein